MEIKIKVLELADSIRYLYLTKQLSNFRINHQTSCLTADKKMEMLDGMKHHQVAVYDFSSIMKLDSIDSPYEVVDNTAEILIKFKVGN